MHSEIRARLSDYLQRDLDPEERSQIETHLEACAPCGSELRELRATVSLLRRLPEPGHPPGLAEAVMARVARDGSSPARVRSLLRRAAEPRFAAALAAGIAGVFFLVQARDRDLSTQALTPAQPGTLARTGSPGGPPAPSLIASAESRRAGALPARAGVVSGATPSGIYAAYTRRSKLEEMARQLRGAGHPYSESLAAHFDAQPSVVLADWQPR